MLEFNLRQLEVFAAAADCRSFTGAAQVLYLTQSTVSAHIRALEQTVGAPLFDRDDKKHIRLTEAGRALYPRAADILERCRALQDAFRPEREPQELILAASTVPCKCVLPGLMAGFLAQEPGCRYLLRKGDSAQVHRLLADREARIGFVGAVLDGERFRYHALLRDKLVLVTANTERFRLLRRSGTLGRDLLGEPMVVREQGSGTRQRFDAYLAGAGIPPETLRIVARIDQPEAVLSAVESGVGVTVCSELAARELLDAERLLEFELDAASLYRALYLAVEKHAVLTALERAFVAFTLDRYRGG